MPQGRGAAKKRRRRRKDTRQGVTVWHGTSDSLGLSIAGNGLQPRDGIGPFVSIDKNRAAGYAVRAVCAALVEMDAVDEPHRAPLGLLVEAKVNPATLERDPSHAGDYIVRGGCSGDRLRFRPFDATPYLPDADGIREYARLMSLAQAIEPRRTWLHGGSADAAA